MRPWRFLPGAASTRKHGVQAALTCHRTHDQGFLAAPVPSLFQMCSLQLPPQELFLLVNTQYRSISRVAWKFIFSTFIYLDILCCRCAGDASIRQCVHFWSPFSPDISD